MYMSCDLQRYNFSRDFEIDVSVLVLYLLAKKSPNPLINWGFSLFFHSSVHAPFVFFFTEALTFVVIFFTLG